MEDQDRTGTDADGTVDREQAFRHAVLAVRQAAASGVDDFEGWDRAEVDPDPIQIDDLGGQALFYDFTVADVGVVRAAANSLVGSPVVSLQLGTHAWSPREAMDRASKAASARLEQDAVATSLVCYSYPKIGVRVEHTDREGDRRAQLLDVADQRPIEVFGADEPEGLTSYSFLGEAARAAPTRLRRFAAATTELEAWNEAAPEVTEGRPIDLAVVRSLLLKEVSLAYFPLYSWNTVRYAPRCARPEVFQLYAQQTNVFCAVATGQMILDFYKYHFSQNAIATAMSTGSGGTSNSGQVTGYESLSGNGLTAVYDTSASWAEAKAEIDANRPIKSGIPGHARAVAGWKRHNISLVGSTPSRWLKVYDPWPWNADICDGGAVYWEDWDAVTHTNWIKVQHA